MSAVLALRLAILVVGLALWGWGARTDDASLRMIAIALLALSLVLRFYKPRRRD